MLICGYSQEESLFYYLNIFIFYFQVVKLREVFPHGTGFVLVFEFMLSDLSEVVRNAEIPLMEAQVKSYLLMLLKGVAFCHENNIMHRVCIHCYLQDYIIYALGGGEEIIKEV